MNPLLQLRSYVWLVAAMVAMAPKISRGEPQLLPAAIEPGKSYFSRHEYVEYIAGNLPLVISVPHGGRQKPSDIPERVEGTLAFDRNTQELARAIVKAIHDKTGGWPHVVICKLSRTRVDCNREIKEATAGNPSATIAWNDYHSLIEHARKTVGQSHGRGLFIDLHGHGHPPQRLEIGYLLSQTLLQLDDEKLSDPKLLERCSLQSVALRGRTSFVDLIRGKQSFGTMMEAQGFPATPSAKTPHPPIPYFRGGYNVDRHGRDGAPLAGFQIECNYTGVRDTPENMQRFGQAITSVLEAYYPIHFGIDFAPAQDSEQPGAKPREEPPVQPHSQPAATSEAQSAPSTPAATAEPLAPRLRPRLRSRMRGGCE